MDPGGWGPGRCPARAKQDLPSLLFPDIFLLSKGVEVVLPQPSQFGHLRGGHTGAFIFDARQNLRASKISPTIFNQEVFMKCLFFRTSQQIIFDARQKLTRIKNKRVCVAAALIVILGGGPGGDRCRVPTHPEPGSAEDLGLTVTSCDPEAATLVVLNPALLAGDPTVCEPSASTTYNATGLETIFH